MILQISTFISLQPLIRFIIVIHSVFPIFVRAFETHLGAFIFRCLGALDLEDLYYASQFTGAWSIRLEDINFCISQGH